MNRFSVDNDLYEEGDLVRQSRRMALEVKSNQIRVSRVYATDSR